MIDFLLNFDKEIFLYLNSKHFGWLDPLMLAFSSYQMWTAVFLLCGALIYFSSENNRLKVILFYAGSVGFSTLFTNGLKLVIQRSRPIHEEAWKGLIHNIEKHSDAFSFFSSHAATTFCIAVFVFLFFRAKNKRYIGIVALLWATCVSYSRIYVGKHYPLDVLVGILFGMACGYTGYTLLKYYLRQKGSA